MVNPPIKRERQREREREREREPELTHQDSLSWDFLICCAALSGLNHNYQELSMLAFWRPKAYDAQGNQEFPTELLSSF